MVCRLIFFFLFVKFNRGSSLGLPQYSYGAVLNEYATLTVDLPAWRCMVVHEDDHYTVHPTRENARSNLVILARRYDCHLTEL